MKRVREFRTLGDFIICKVTFLPDPKDDDEVWEDFATIPTIKDGCHLRMSFLLRYPKIVEATSVSSRFWCSSHPNLSPVLVTEEASRFLSIIKQMLEL